jgi:hypothetical protein
MKNPMKKADPKKVVSPTMAKKAAMMAKKKTLKKKLY